MATWLNNVSIACLIAGFLQPLLGLVQAQRSFRLAEAALSLILVLASAALVAASQLVARRLED